MLEAHLFSVHSKLVGTKNLETNVLLQPGIAVVCYFDMQKRSRYDNCGTLTRRLTLPTVYSCNRSSNTDTYQASVTVMGPVRSKATNYRTISKMNGVMTPDIESTNPKASQK